MRRLTSLAAPAAAVVALAAALAACGGGSSSSSTTTTTSRTTSTTSPTSASGGAATITIKNFAFQPPNMTVKAGTRITVTNQDSAAHTVTANNNAFDTGDINGGASKTFTAPSNLGSYAYHCTIHPFMHGTLTVTSS
ncbi:MAG TPA: cupredoxin domain-containing protein [Acidimicrobiales bacterium]|nr:cupredoxin domain-containing protein [Acidimicrobiales bacterium]